MERGVTSRLLVGGLALALALGARPAIADEAPRLVAGGWTLAPVVDARLRAEYRDDEGRESGTLVERARLGADVTTGALAARVVVQEAAVIGAGSSLTGGPTRFEAVDLHALWGAWEPSTAPVRLRIGRQPVAWGEGRLLGTDEWSPTGRTFDALTLRAGTESTSVDLLAALLTTAAIPTLEPYGELLGLRAQASWGASIALEAYGLARVAQDTPVPSVLGTVRGTTYTGALRAHGEARAVRWGLEGAYQAGHVDELGEDRSAWALASHVAYVLPGLACRPAIELAVSYASGDRGGRTYRGFDPLFPDVHRWQGAMDVFAWSNEAEASAGLSIAPWAGAQARAEYRYARLAQASGPWFAADLTTIGAAPGNAHADLGHEVDLALTWQTDPRVGLAASYSILALGAGGRAIVAANQLGSGDVSHLVLVQATLRIP